MESGSGIAPPTVVTKFGGSSLANSDALKRVAKQVVERRRQGTRMVVVVSAMGKTTDRLLDQAKEVSTSPPQRELDMLVTAGERISMAMLSMAIADLGEDSISFTGSQSGIMTEDSHQGARIIEVRPHRIVTELEAGKIVIVAGYQGVSTRREVTTLGRGGSDTTAVALAAALNADACEIYSDVDGVYSADPRVCSQALLLRSLSYETMEAMSVAGAKVLNREAVSFAKRAGITIVARQTGDESDRRTEVRAGAPSSIRAAVAAEQISLLEGRLPEETSNFVERVGRVGGRVVSLCVNGKFPGFACVDRTDIAGEDIALIIEIATDLGLAHRVVALVSVVGAGAESDVELIRGCTNALERQQIATFVSMVGSSLLTWAVKSDEADDAVRCLHAAANPGLSPST